MKTTIVPAQMTTVEDRIAGSLTLHQLLLVICAILVNFMIYLLPPASMKLAAWKLVLMTLIATSCLLLAIRIRGRLVLLWLVMIARYNVRSRYYVWNKNDACLRYEPTPVAEAEEQQEDATEEATSLWHLPLEERIEAEEWLTRKVARLSFRANKKGGLHVHITEVEPENI